MKRTFWGLFAALGLAFIGLAPSQALAVTCAPVTVTVPTPGAYPQGYLYSCTGVAPADTQRAVAALQSMPAFTQTQLKTGVHKFFVFASQADYYSYTHPLVTGQPFVPYVAPPAKAEGNTFNDPVSLTDWYSQIFIDKLTSTAANRVNVATAHETGHHLDYIYRDKLGNATARFASEVGSTVFAQKLTGIYLTVGGGPINAGDQLTLQVFNPIDVPSWTVTSSPLAELTYVAVGGESLADIATWFYTHINASSIWTTSLKLHANPPVGATFTIDSNEIRIFQQKKNPTGHETFTVFNFHDFPGFIRQSPNIGTTPQCGSNGVFTGQKDDSSVAGAYYCDGTNGTGPNLVAPYSNSWDNYTVISQSPDSWSYFYTQDTSGLKPRWAELFAELTAVVTGNIESGAGTKTPDTYLKSGYFTCVKIAMTSVFQTGNLPTFTGVCR